MHTDRAPRDGYAFKKVVGRRVFVCSEDPLAQFCKGLGVTRRRRRAELACQIATGQLYQ